MLRSISLTIGATFLGQVIGFLSDILIAGSFGTSWKADAYFLALVIPIILADLFVASINAVFIPFYVSNRVAAAADAFFSTITNSSMIIISGVTAAAFFLSPVIIGFVGKGFSPEARELTVILTKILLVLTITMPLTTFISCRLNVHDQFFFPALGKFFNFLFIILSLLAFKKTLGIFSLPLGFVAGNVLFVLSLLVLFFRTGLGYSPKIDLTNPLLKESAMLVLPMVAAGMVNYVNIFVERSVAASFPEGSIAALNYSFKLVNIPVNLFILGGMSVLLPALSRHASNMDINGLKEITLKGLRLVSFFIIPVIVGMAILRVPLIRFFFERGEFTVESTRVTSMALLFYVFGLLGQASTTLLTRVFYATKEIKALSVIGILIILLNITLVLLLSRTLGFIGIPLTFSITLTVHMIIMFSYLGKKLGLYPIGPLIKDLGLYFVSSAGMGLLILAVMPLAGAYIDISSKMGLLFYLSLLVLFGAAAYLAISIILKVKESNIIFHMTISSGRRLYGAGTKNLK